MEEKVLSQNEISALLDAVGEGEGAEGVEASNSEVSTKKRRKGVGLAEQEGYLFPMAKAQELSKEVESALALIFDAFSHKGGATLSHSLRTQVSFRIHDVEQIFYGDFIESLPEPSSIWYLDVKPHNLHLGVCFDVELVNHLVSVMLGGGQQSEGPKPRNHITDLEQSMVEGVVTIFCRELRHAWSRVAEVEISIDNRETRPRLLRIYPPNEIVVTVGMSMKIGESEGAVYWGIPSALLSTLQDSLVHQRQIESREKLIEVVVQMRQLAESFETTLEVDLCQTSVSVTDLLALKVGDVLALEHRVGDPAFVFVNGCERFRGEILHSNDRRAVRLVDSLG